MVMLFNNELRPIIVHQHNTGLNMGIYGVTSRAGRIWGKLHNKTYVLQATPKSGSWSINFLAYNRSEDRELGAKTVQEPPNKVIVVLLKVTSA